MQVLKVTATGLARTGFTEVAGVTLVAAAADATVVVNDSLTGSDAANDKGGASALLKTSRDATLHDTQFATGVYVTLAGVGAVAFIYYK